MKNFRWLFGIVGLLMSGCVFHQNSYIAPREYDLTSAEAQVANLTADFGVFRNFSGSDRRFLVRVSPVELQSDEYKRWLLSPEMLVKRTLCLAAGNAVAAPPQVKVDCTLYCFEFNQLKNSAEFSAVYLVRDQAGKQGRFQHRFSQRCTARTGRAQGEAMARCVAASATLLGQEIADFKRKDK